MSYVDPYEQAARLIASAGGLIITAGAGMGVDSGLPDFRGNDGFWRAYPALAASGIGFSSIANPASFHCAPRQAWGFYGHRLRLYRETVPHEGFRVLIDIAARLPRGAFVYTSNVDGQFQKAGFPEGRVCEVHGAIEYLQCLEPCCRQIWSADHLRPKTDDRFCEWFGPLPICIHCGALARPNILMFDDLDWIEERTELQRMRFKAWLDPLRTPVVIELGAGIDIPTIRRFGERQGLLIRINPNHAAIPMDAGVSLSVGAKLGLARIRAALERLGFFEEGLAS